MVLAILKRVAIGVGAATLLVVAVSFFLPSTYSVTRTQVIAAEPIHIHALVNDLERWPEWTPWLESDPTMTVTRSAVTAGVGAHQSWQGESGDGELTFTASDPTVGITYDMTFDGGKYASESIIRYAAVPGGTEVTWNMTGENGLNPMARYFGLVMDSAVGPMFEDGLAKLKLVSEQAVSEGVAP